MRTLTLPAVALLLLAIVTAATIAQPAQAPPARGQRFGGTVGAGFHAKHTQDQLLAIQEHLGISDDDWKTLGPKVEKVIVAKQNLSTGAGMNFTASNNNKPTFQASTAKPDTAPGKAMQEVRDAVADPKATDEALGKKMAAVRAARQKARAEYEAAQNDLIDEISAKQQAMLMTLGVIE